MKKTFFIFRSDLRWEENEFLLSLFLFSSLFEWLLFSIRCSGFVCLLIIVVCGSEFQTPSSYGNSSGKWKNANHRFSVINKYEGHIVTEIPSTVGPLGIHPLGFRPFFLTHSEIIPFWAFFHFSLVHPRRELLFFFFLTMYLIGWREKREEENCEMGIFNASPPLVFSLQTGKKIRGWNMVINTKL